MNYKDIRNNLSYLRTLVFFESVFPHDLRRPIQKVLFIVSAILFLISSGIFGVVDTRISGLTLIFITSFLFVTLIEAYFYSMFDSRRNKTYDFELAELILHSSSRDVVSGFCKSSVGRGLLLRAGISKEGIKDFKKSRKFGLLPSKINVAGDNIFEGFIKAILEQDDEFRRLLVSSDVRIKEFTEAVFWAISLERERINYERWWSENRLKTTRPIGEGWSYGRAYALLSYAAPLRVTIDENTDFRLNEALQVESVLSKARDANAIIVGPEGIGKLEVMERLLVRVRRDEAPKDLRHYDMLIFDTAAFAANNDTKSRFERELISILKAAERAGNVILIISDLYGFIADGRALGSDVMGIVSPYLESQDMHVVAICGIESFHRHIEPDKALMKNFEIIKVEEGTITETLDLMKKQIVTIEHDTRAFYTYSSIVEAVNSASQYFPDSSKIDTATDLLIEASSLTDDTISREDILDLVERRTGIPTGAVSAEEREKLTNLPDLLHQRIVGQDIAVTAISDALTRARSGIGNPNRPIGSFLFMGPTGVGKTETTKALAEIFFGDESDIVRFDMSEYNTPDALSRLIGDPRTREPGILASKVREKPYGVMLLDEFEKTDKRVLDLFLQILDEGMFSDYRGSKVSVRNMIIIATSNAGSPLIFDIVKSGGDLASERDNIIDSIIDEGIFKPELLNRFDGVILFHPLDKSHLKKIAEKMLGKLSWRLKEKGVHLEINEELLDFLIEKGSDPKFGARELNRAIQDNLEKVIAKRLISGELGPGSTYSFKISDLE